MKEKKEFIRTSEYVESMLLQIAITVVLKLCLTRKMNTRVRSMILVIKDR